MKFSALAVAAFVSLVSAQANSTVIVHPTHTNVVYSTDIKTITSCADGKCTKHLTSEVVPVPQSTVVVHPTEVKVVSSIQTLTITSCADNKCFEHVTTTTVPCTETSAAASSAAASSSAPGPKVVTETCTESVPASTASAVSSSAPAPPKVATETEVCHDCPKTSSAPGAPKPSTPAEEKPVSSAPVAPKPSTPVVPQQNECPAPVTVTVTVSVPANCGAESTPVVPKAPVESTPVGPKSPAVETTPSSAVVPKPSAPVYLPSGNSTNPVKPVPTNGTHIPTQPAVSTGAGNNLVASAFGAIVIGAIALVM